MVDKPLTTDPLSDHPSAPGELDVRDYLDVLRRRKSLLFGIFLAVLAAGTTAVMFMQPVYQTEAKLLVPGTAPSVNVVDASNPIASMLASAQPNTLGTQVQILQSREFLEEAKKKAGIGGGTGTVDPTVTIEGIHDANVINITVEGEDPRQIAALANTIVDLHSAKMDEAEVEGLGRTIQFVRQRKEKAADDLALAEQKLVAFRRGHHIVELDSAKEAQAREFASVQNTLNEAQTKVAAARAQIAELKARLAREPNTLVNTSLKDNPRRAKLENRLDDLRLQRMDLLHEFRPTSRPVQDLDRNIARVQQQLNAEPATLTLRTHDSNPSRQPLVARLMQLENELQGHLATYSEAKAQIDSEHGAAATLGPLEIQENRLVQERSAAQTAYNAFAERLRDLETRSSAHLRMAHEIQSAMIPSQPIRPKRIKYIAMAAILGLFLGTGTAFLKEHLDDRVHSPVDLERVSDLPSLGYIPHIGRPQERLVASLPAASQLAEAYRALRLSIDVDGTATPVRRLLVTSSSPSEGKTTTAVNLASAMAVDGKQVILVDADFRRPGVGRLLNLANAPGFSDALEGKASVDEVIRATEVENLRAVCAGSAPSNPAALLRSTAFEVVLQQLGDRADLVIFDTPPCLPVTDPLIMAPHMDGVMLVVQVGETRRGALGYAVELLARARAPLVGIVQNNVPPHQGGYYYPRYYDYDYSQSDGGGRRRSRRHSNGHGAASEIENGTPLAAASGATADREI